MTPLDYARHYVDAGISVFPIARDGSKAPDWRLLPQVWDHSRGRGHASWNPLRDRLPTPAEIENWWDREEPPGLAAVCGDLAGGLEVLDFDSQAVEVFAQWSADVGEECPGLLSRLCVVQTPRDPVGYHVWIRCGDQPCAGNRNLAVDPSASGKERTLIQTRGEGGYALVPGSPGACHPTGREYQLVSGAPLWKLEHVSLDEHEVLTRCARALNREVKEDRPPPPARGEPSGLRPGEDFDRRGPDWSEILTPRGWVLAGGHGEERRWRRPGKDRGWSATTGHCHSGGVDLLRVFTSSAHPLEDGRAYGRFRTLTLLEFGGDHSACARTLSRLGYGEQRPVRTEKKESLAELVLRGLAEADPAQVRAILERALGKG